MENSNADPTSEKKIGTGVAIGLVAAGVFAGFVLSAIIAAAGYALRAGDGSFFWSDLITKFGLLLGTMMFAVPAVVYVMGRYDWRTVFRWRPVSSTILTGTVLLSFGLIVLTDALDKTIAPAINAYLDGTIGQLSPQLMSERILEQLAEEMRFKNPLSAVLLILAAVAAAALCEELLMRGLFQGVLERSMPAIGAIFVSSTVFSMVHLNPWGGIQIFVLAIVLGVVAWRTQSIIPTITIHAVNNGAVLIYHNLDPSWWAWYGDETRIFPSVVAAGALLLAAGGWIVFRNQPVRAL